MMIQLTKGESLHVEQVLEDVLEEHREGEDAPLFFEELEERIIQALEIVRSANVINLEKEIELSDKELDDILSDRDSYERGTE